MDSLKALLPRDASSPTLSPTTVNLIIALLSLVIVGIIALAALYAIKKVRSSRAAKAAANTLPQYNEGRNASHLTIQTTNPYNGRVSSSSIYVYDEKSSMMSHASSTPTSPVPEIRITFPDEQDESGRPTSGRVVVVRVAEHGYGLEPLSDEQLPKYEKETGGRFQSIDMERIGGLKEKNQQWS